MHGAEVTEPPRAACGDVHDEFTLCLVCDTKVRARRKSIRVQIDGPVKEAPKTTRLETARAIVTNFKAAPKARDEEYLGFVRTYPCCACGKSSAQSEAHHFGPRGMGEKCSDYFAVPLCATCHRCFHDEGKIECEVLMQRVRDHALADDPPHWLARLVTEHAFHLAQATLLEAWIAKTGAL